MHKQVLVFLFALLLMSGFVVTVYADYYDGFEYYPVATVNPIGFGNNQGWRFTTNCGASGDVGTGAAGAYSGNNAYEIYNMGSCTAGTDYGEVSLTMISEVSTIITATFYYTAGTDLQVVSQLPGGLQTTFTASTGYSKFSMVSGAVVSGQVFTMTISCQFTGSGSPGNGCDIDNLVVIGANLYNHPTNFQMRDFGNVINTTIGYSNPPVGVLIPFYVYPNATWNTLISDHQAYPNVPITAIINQNNGVVGTCSGCQGQDPNYASYIPTLTNAGIRVIAYVNTNGGSCSCDGGVSISTLEGYINAYYSFYPQISGIFFDNMANGGTVGTPSYYSTLNNYVHGLAINQLTVGNPGTKTTSAYIGTMDIINSYEGSGTPSTSTVDTNTIGTGGVRTQWSILVHDQPSLPALSYFQTVDAYVANLYFTQKTEASNPWSNLASYFSTELSDLNQLGTQVNVTSKGSLYNIMGLGSDPTLYINYVSNVPQYVLRNLTAPDLNLPFSTNNATQITVFVNSQYYRSVIPDSFSTSNGNTTMYLDPPNLVNSYLFQFVNPTNTLAVNDRIYFYLGGQMITSGYLDAGLTFAPWLRATTYSVEIFAPTGPLINPLFSSLITTSPSTTTGQTTIQILVSNQVVNYQPTLQNSISIALTLTGTNQLTASFNDASTSTTMVNMTLYQQTQLSGQTNLGTNCVSTSSHGSCSVQSSIGIATTIFSPILFNETSTYSVRFTFIQNGQTFSIGPYFITNGSLFSQSAGIGNNCILGLCDILSSSFNSTTNIILDMVSLILVIAIGVTFEGKYANFGVLIVVVVTGVLYSAGWINLLALGIPSAALAVLGVLGIMSFIQDKEKQADNLYE